LQDYNKQTGVDLTKYDFANQLERCRSPDEVLMVLRDKAKKFKEYRDGNRKLINWLTPVVQVVHVFAGFLGEATSIVSRKALKPFECLF
jgi:fungal STAND N-terminal Goodbye domain